jgi:uroporphyrinogen decarboxylase
VAFGGCFSSLEETDGCRCADIPSPSYHSLRSLKVQGKASLPSLRRGGENADRIIRTGQKWVLGVVEITVELGGIDGFALSDDWGGTAGLLMSPAHLRRFFLRPFAEIVRGIQAYGLPVMMHNDGNIWHVLDDLVNTGINGYHPVEKAAGMDLRKVKDRYGSRLCLIGNINNKQTMVSGTAEDVQLEALECLRIGAPGGGYVLATNHSLHDDIPTSNIYAFIRTAKEHGRYPLAF